MYSDVFKGAEYFIYGAIIAIAAVVFGVGYWVGG